MPKPVQRKRCPPRRRRTVKDAECVPSPDLATGDTGMFAFYATLDAARAPILESSGTAREARAPDRPDIQ